jgi:DNA-binding transcriptional LysR family regulator
MELREIRTFLVVADELHFTRAAARLHVAQSAVSHAIQKLEAELGVALFARTRRRVALTAAGERFRTDVTEATAALDAAAEIASRSARGEAGRLVLRFTVAAALTIIPRAVARFHKAYPAVELDLQPGGSSAQLEAIHAGRCDVGFLSLQRDVTPLATEVVQRAPLVAVLPTAHPLARRRRVQFADLAGERFVMLELASEPRVRDRIRARCVAAGFEPEVVLEVGQLEVLLAMVAAGVGITCVPALVRALRFAGVVTIPITPVVEGGISVVWDPATLSAAAGGFLAILREERVRHAGASRRRR